MVQIADLTVLGKAISGLFGINGVWSSFLSSEIITLAVILILARSGRKKNVFSGERI
ncbi:MAG: hypothetical protein KH027_14875 [Clostridiales bacterium]|nr:hypothetical protein [Clostridiales bacterium]